MTTPKLGWPPAPEAVFGKSDIRKQRRTRRSRAARIPEAADRHGYDRRMRCRVLVATAVAFVCLLAIAHPAGAQDTGGEPERDRRISVTGGLVVAEGETV